MKTSTLLIMRILLVALFTLFTTQAWAKIDVYVDKARQLMTVSIDQRETYQWPVSTGDRNHDTPNGVWKAFRMEEDHFSIEFDNAPMPNSIFFTQKGHAIHGSFEIKLLGKPVSHGCIRLHPDNARVLYSLVKQHGLVQTTVVVDPGGQ